MQFFILSKQPSRIFEDKRNLMLLTFFYSPRWAKIRMSKFHFWMPEGTTTFHLEIFLQTGLIDGFEI